MSYTEANPFPISTTLSLAPELSLPPYKPLSKSDIIGLVLFGICGVSIIAVFYLVILPIFYRCHHGSARDEENSGDVSENNGDNKDDQEKVEGHFDNVKLEQGMKTGVDGVGGKWMRFGAFWRGKDGKDGKDEGSGEVYNLERYGGTGNLDVSPGRASSGARLAR